jgi:16S rRNA (guanine527-N7)-methyltransferase
MNFKSLLNELSLLITDEALQKFEDYYQLLIEWNQKFNLTAITDHDEVYIKHFYDSLLMAKVVDLTKINTLCDIGSGAGFPSLPLKIIFPHLKITIIEPTQKRTIFLNEVVNKLGLTDVTILNERAEDKANEYREHFDIVTARAVARMNVLLELTFSYVKQDGVFIAYKGKNFEEEMIEADYAIKLLGGKTEDIYIFDLPLDLGGRSLISIKKIKKTPKDYPRSYAKIKNKPLIFGGNNKWEK